jgi:cyclic beta-1,2-glucan synthetase
MRGVDAILTTFLRRLVERRRTAPPWDSMGPIREELLSLERLEEHARTLALSHTVTPKRMRGHSLAGRLSDNAAVLLDAYRVNAKANDEGRAITPAAEWLIDNYHLVERQIREIQSDLPPGYYRQLPKLLDGPLAGYPRILAIAWSFVAHTDSRFDPETLCHFMRGYQHSQVLEIGEIWALAITLRIVLVENLRRLAERIVISRAARRDADSLADRLLGVGGPLAGSVAARCPDTAIAYGRRGRASTIARPGPRMAPALTGSTSAWRSRERRSMPWSARNTTGKVPRASRCATSSPACA